MCHIAGCCLFLAEMFARLFAIFYCLVCLGIGWWWWRGVGGTLHLLTYHPSPTPSPHFYPGCKTILQQGAEILHKSWLLDMSKMSNSLLYKTSKIYRRQV